MNLKIRRERKPALFGALATICAGLIGLSPIGTALCNLSYDLPFLFRTETKPPPSEVCILYMDEDSRVNLREKALSGWDRTIHARAIERLNELQAKVIVLDILFKERSDPLADEALVQAARKHGNVFFTAEVKPEVTPDLQPTATILNPFTNALQWGLAEHGDAGHWIRQHYRDNAFDYPTVAWRAAEAWSGSPGDRRNPRWINYYGPPGILTNYSYFQLFSNGIPSIAISNKVVFIGAKYSVGFLAGVGTDFFRTPFTLKTEHTQSPGVEVIATAFCNLIHRDWLTELPDLFEYLLVVALGVALGGGLILARPRAGFLIAVGAVLLIAILGVLLPWSSLRSWWPWIVSLIQAPVAWVFSLFVHVVRLEKTGTLASAMPQPTPLIPASDLPAKETLVVASPHNWPAIPDYKPVREIDHGAFGAVWLASDVIGNFRAVKIIRRTGEHGAETFNREFRGLQSFNPISRSHPGFVDVLHVGPADPLDYFYYVMELGDDINTGQKIDSSAYSPRTLARQIQTRGPVPLQEGLRIALNLVSALQYLHEQKLIHRDIKPSNIIFVNGLPKFADIGLVTGVAQPGHDVSFAGTRDFIPLEGPGSPPADIYSMGKVLYYMFTGIEPRHFPELPTGWTDNDNESGALMELNRIIVKACEPDVRHRYRSTSDLLADLQSLSAVAAP